MGSLTSGHAFTAYLYHQSAGAGHECSPDRGHEYHVAVELTTEVADASDDEAMVLRTVVAELERDLQYRELGRLGHEPRPSADRFVLARWVHATITQRLADTPGARLRVGVECPGEGPQPATFPAI
ncbi:hypothetical protein AB0D49_13480 [Streptomyces sp. NPDC048290]|uniref:hypothetical protein n=1 Tax=Streptomyces sp. NPDC048290 TaxID=3155811 RepID=UPI00344852D1